ncbi:signal transduction histidine-protein kinase/phosphatase UhpB [Photobacterium japonica]|uniref:signal transduction histidine-protein kinase/phosphatase UhpB n=1 Tax=Photobacterium japonica TaxID=2910235 RepID=UPI003D10132F
MRHLAVTSLVGGLLLACGWFCLWVIATYFTLDPELAVFLFPFALRLGVLLHCPKRFWPAVYVTEWLLLLVLASQVGESIWQIAMLASLLSVPVLWFAHRHYIGTQLHRLTVMGAVIVATSLLNMVVASALSQGLMVLLVSVTGGLMLVPSCYLVWSYLFQQTWVPLTVDLVSRPVSLRVRHVLLYVAVLIGSIVLQLGLPEELRRFAPFCLAIPIILLAFRYGWQGALMGTLFNSIALIAARSSGSDLAITDLLLSLTAQSLTGILLGMGIQRQRELNQQLRLQLSRNHSLSRQLITAEESVRREIARELHDEIGQNITAIRTQASIIKRVDTPPMGIHCADTIEALSLNIYDTTKGLLTRLRPKTLDDMGLEAAIAQLIRDLECERHGIHTTVTWRGDGLSFEALSDTLSVTVYRLCQEAVNNVVKYAQASTLHLEFVLEKENVHVQIRDDGKGFAVAALMQASASGFGLRGMQERVEALGGQIAIKSRMQSPVQGTDIHIQLPVM